MLIFHGEESLAPGVARKLGDHSLSAIRGSLFNMPHLQTSQQPEGTKFRVDRESLNKDRKEQDGMAWSGLCWLRTGTSGGVLNAKMERRMAHNVEPLASQKDSASRACLSLPFPFSLQRRTVFWTATSGSGRSLAATEQHSRQVS